MSYTYPMWFKVKNNKMVVKFRNLTSGIVVVENEKIDDCEYYVNGHNSEFWAAHTEDNIWEDVTNSFNPLNFGINTKEAPKCQHEVSFDAECSECIKLLKNSENNGGKTDYYQIKSAPFKINDFDDFAEWREMNGNQFNIGKVVWTFNVGRHDGTNYERDLNKIIHYANRELMRIAKA